MHAPNQFDLLRERRFAPFFWTQFAGALNDNLFKNALVIFLAFQAAGMTGADANTLVNLAGAVFIAPFVLLSATAGQLADKYEKSRLIRQVKLLEIAVMAVALYGFWQRDLIVLFAALGLMGVQSTLFGPVKYAILPQHLRREELTGGNGLVEMGTFVAILLGTIAAGFLASIGTGTVSAAVIGIATVTFVVWLVLGPSPALNYALLNTEPVVAHRNRIDFLVGKLRSECVRRAACGKTRVLNLACGPALEILRFLRECPESDLAEIDLLDFNAETLEYTRESLAEARTAGGRRTELRYFQRSVHQLLRAATQGGVDEFSGYDFVYCAGLFDYLSQRVCKRMVELFCTMVKPGGKVVVTNVATRNPRKAWMEYVMEWNLIYRDENEMMDLVPEGLKVKDTTVGADATGVNLMLEIELAHG